MWLFVYEFTRFFRGNCIPSDVLTEFVERNGWRSLSVVMSKSAGSKTGSQKVEMLTYNYDAERDRQRCLF